MTDSNQEVRDDEYHYIFGVGVKGINSSNPGELELDVFLLFTHDQYEDIRRVKAIATDKLLKTTYEEAAEMFNIKDLAISYKQILLRKAIQDFSLHHIYSSFEMTREILEEWLRNSKYDKDVFKKLKESRI